MKRLVTVAVAAVVFVPPLCAQRAAAHGSFSSHSSSAFRGGFTTSTPHSFQGAPRYTGRGAVSSPPRFLGGAPRNFVSRPNYYGSGRYRRSYSARYGYGVPYLGAGWIAPGYPTYPDITPYDDSDSTANYAAGYDNPQPDQAEPVPAAPPYPIYTEPLHPLQPLPN
jgi:hypothetical protein